jgi:hypothetical protein
VLGLVVVHVVVFLGVVVLLVVVVVLYALRLILGVTGGVAITVTVERG